VDAICREARAPRRGEDRDLAEAIVLAMAVAVETRDRNTEAHCQRIARHAAATGVALGLGAEAGRTLVRGGYLHDLGKIVIPDRILLKPAALTAEEERTMRLHPLIGDALCRRVAVLAAVRPIVRWHHERLDGSGYPDGLTGDRVPLLAQIVGVADMFDAITSARPYKPALPAAVACEMLTDEVRNGWRRRDLVDAFLHTLEAGAGTAAPAPPSMPPVLSPATDLTASRMPLRRAA
jgi:putative two-component system response regulator